MEIYGPGHIDGPQSIKAPHRARAIEPQATADDVQNIDQVDISAEADMVSQVHSVADIRTDRVTEIRAEIAAGTYETDEKLDLAVGKLLDEIG
ncbi:MAG: flagellar biosynthesis protein FlgM [Planctomycetaceae bacterium]|nr:flagellar biosynthesis protein FlgM [Planctomycetaceae bacterium]